MLKSAMSSILSLFIVMSCSALVSCSNSSFSNTITTEKNTSEAISGINQATDTESPAMTLGKNIKILAIGNSFSEDAVDMLWQILDDIEVEEIILGHLYISGSSLQMHNSNFKSNKVAYQYKKNTNGSWVTRQDSILNGLADEEWDIVTIQQASGESGLLDSYKVLEELVPSIKNNLPSDCKLFWHMTWAYQQDSNHSAFAYYSNNQMEMYKAIINTVQSTILKNNDFSGVIPTGTAIQNLRTSYFGDTITRDGFHLNLFYGRYTASLTWLASLFGTQVLNDVSWYPKGISSENLPPIFESVKNAVLMPYDQTPSEYLTGTLPQEPIYIDVSENKYLVFNLYENPDYFFGTDKIFNWGYCGGLTSDENCVIIPENNASELSIMHGSAHSNFPSDASKAWVTNKLSCFVVTYKTETGGSFGIKFSPTSEIWNTSPAGWKSEHRQIIYLPKSDVFSTIIVPLDDSIKFDSSPFLFCFYGTNNSSQISIKSFGFFANEESAKMYYGI